MLAKTKRIPQPKRRLAQLKPVVKRNDAKLLALRVFRKSVNRYLTSDW